MDFVYNEQDALLGAAKKRAIFGGIRRYQRRHGGGAGVENHRRGRGTKFYSQFLYFRRFSGC